MYAIIDLITPLTKTVISLSMTQKNLKDGRDGRKCLSTREQGMEHKTVTRALLYYLDELERAISTAKNRKATGLDEIPTEILNALMIKENNRSYHFSIKYVKLELSTD